MRSKFPLAATVLLAAGLPILAAAPASARSWMERNAQSGTEHGEASGFSAASPGIAAEARYHGQRGWRRHHHYRRYYRY